MLLTAVKMGMLMASNLGYWEYFRKKWGVNIFLAPALTLAVQFTVMYLPGLLNFLPEGVICLYVGGLLLFLWSLHKEGWGLFRPYFTVGYAVFGLLLAVIAVTVRDQIFSEIDCFTHWAVVVKNMLAADRFPTFAQSAVGFVEYPLGCSFSVYYFCKMVGTGENMQMMAQGYVLSCMVLPMFSAAGKNSILAGIFVILTANLFLCFNIPVVDLRVDTVLPMTAMSMGLVVYDNTKQYGQEKNLLYIGFPGLFFLWNIKSTGVFFALVIAASLALRYRHRRSALVMLGWVMGLLLAGHFLWMRHCDYVFLNAENSQHALSWTYFQRRLSERSAQDILLILERFFSYAVTRQEFCWLAAWMVLLGALTKLFRRERKKAYWVLAGFTAGVYLLYSLSVAAMYVLSMERDLALKLESAQRYMRIVDLFLLYGMAVYSLDLMANVKTRWRCLAAGTTAAGLMLAMLMLCDMDNRWVWRQENQVEERMYIQGVLEEYGVQKGYRYLVCAQTPYLGYPGYLCRYILDTDQVLQIKVTDYEQMEVEKNFDYILIFDEENPVLSEWILGHYPEQSGRTVIQCFK